MAAQHILWLLIAAGIAEMLFRFFLGISPIREILTYTRSYFSEPERSRETAEEIPPDEQHVPNTTKKENQ